LQTSDTITVQGPHRSGCMGTVDRRLRAAAADTAFTVALNPSRTNQHWCAGRFKGELVQTETYHCPGGPPAAIACPLFLVAPRTLARFSFRVTRHRGVASSADGL
jgi:hypothetical protein